MKSMFSPISLVDMSFDCVITKKYVYFDNDPCVEYQILFRMVYCMLMFLYFDSLKSFHPWWVDPLKEEVTKGDNKLHVVIYLFIYEMAVIHWKDSTVYLHQVTWMEVI
jgi:hypothetical protein